MSDSKKAAYTETDPLITSRIFAQGLQTLGLQPGMTVIVHSSFKKIIGTGYMVGGPQAVIDALITTLTPDGTLVMPTHTPDQSDPAGWVNPPVPESWWPIIRAERPVFDPARAPVSKWIGVIPQVFRTYPGVLRSGHPLASFAAWGRHAAQIVSGDPLGNDLGPDSPIGQVYTLEGQVLLLGVGHGNNSSLHLAEQHALWKGKTPDFTTVTAVIDGERRDVQIRAEFVDTTDFEQIGLAFGMAHPEKVRIGTVGAAETTLIPQRPLVDFAIQWMEQHRPGSLEKKTD